MSTKEGLARKQARKEKRREASKKITGRSATKKGQAQVIDRMEGSLSRGHTRSGGGSRRGWHYDYQK